MLANGLLGSAKPGLTEPSYQSAAKRLMMVIKARGAHTDNNNNNDRLTAFDPGQPG